MIPVASKRKAPKGRQQRTAKPASSDPIELVVRRGALRRFAQLKKKTADLPVNVSWDRRTAERRASSAKETDADRRATERRQKPPFTWEMADFVVVVPSPRRPARQKTRTKKKKKKKS